MINILIQGKVLEIEKQTYLSTINELGGAVFELARIACDDHRYGSINSNGSQQVHLLQRKDKFHQALLDSIGDRQLRGYFSKLDLLAERVMKQDERMVQWLANYFNFTLDSPEQRKKFNRRLSRERRKAIANGNGSLIWTDEVEWRKLEAEFLRLVTSIGKVSSKIAGRIDFLKLES